MDQEKVTHQSENSKYAYGFQGPQLVFQGKASKINFFSFSATQPITTLKV